MANISRGDKWKGLKSSSVRGWRVTWVSAVLNRVIWWSETEFNEKSHIKDKGRANQRREQVQQRWGRTIFWWIWKAARSQYDCWKIRGSVGEEEIWEVPGEHASVFVGWDLGFGFIQSEMGRHGKREPHLNMIWLKFNKDPHRVGWGWRKQGQYLVSVAIVPRRII